MTTAQMGGISNRLHRATGSLAQDQGVWRMAGKGGDYSLWRNAHGLACSCQSFRRRRACRHVQRLVRYLTEALEDYAREQ